MTARRSPAHNSAVGSIQLDGAFDDGRIGRPPAHVARALIEIAVDDLDGVQGKDPRGARRWRGGSWPASWPSRLPMRPASSASSELATLSTSRETAFTSWATIAKPRPPSPARADLDHGVQRQHAQVARDGADRLDLVVGDLLHFASQVGDFVHGPRLSMRRAIECHARIPRGFGSNALSKARSDLTGDYAQTNG